MKSSVLFLCQHNSARSQMAEAFLNALCPEDFVAESAGIEAGDLNPLVVRAMMEVGIDLSNNTTRRVFEVFQTGKTFRHVVSLCDEASEERCRVLIRSFQRHHWPFPDPAQLTGTDEEKLAGIRIIRDSIRQKTEEWCEKRCAVMR